MITLELPSEVCMAVSYVAAALDILRECAEAGRPQLVSPGHVAYRVHRSHNAYVYEMDAEMAMRRSGQFARTNENDWRLANAR